MTDEISDAAIERAFRLSGYAHAKAAEFRNGSLINGFAYFDAFARFIQTTSDTITRACRMIEEGNEDDAVAELEELVLSKPDPLLIEAREIVKSTLTPDRHKRCNCRTEIDAGSWDEGQKVRATYAALRRGIELGKGQS